MMKDRGHRFHPQFRTADKGQSGQALIELALSLPLFLLLLLGAAEFGRLAYIAIELTDAAKAAAQFGAQGSTTMIDNNAMLRFARQSAPYTYANCTNFTATPQIPLTCTCMTAGTPIPSTPTAAACLPGTCAGGYIVHVLQITTSASCNPIFHRPGFSAGNVTLTGSAVQEVLN